VGGGGKYHEIWRRNPNFKERRTFSKDFKLFIMFPEQRIFSSEKEKIEKATMLTAAGLATPRQAIRLIFPSMTEKELDLYIKELEDGQSRNTVSPDNGEETQGDPQQNEPKQVGSGGSKDSGGTDAG